MRGENQAVDRGSSPERTQKTTRFVVGLTLAISTPAVAQYDYAKQGLKITVANDGGITVTDARTGKTLPCIVTRTGDQKPAVRLVVRGQVRPPSAERNPERTACDDHRTTFPWLAAGC